MDKTNNSGESMRHRIHAVSSVAIAALVLAAPAGATPSYAITNLSALSFQGEDINNEQTIVGNTLSFDGAVTWTAAQGVTSIAGLTRPSAINDQGTMVGISFASNYDHVPVTVSSRGVVTELATNVQLSSQTFANAINDNGQVAGTLYAGSSGIVAVRWNADGTNDQLGYLPGQRYTVPYGINNVGAVVGYGLVNAGEQAFIWDADNGIQGIAPIRTTQSYFNYPSDVSFKEVGQARGINDAGQVVGYVGAGNYYVQRTEAFIWTQAAGTKSLGYLPGYKLDSAAYDINASGTVVGVSSASPEQVRQRAFIWTEASGMLDLNSLLEPDAAGAYTLIAGGKINDNGYILATALDVNGAMQSVLLTPVPELNTRVMFALGVFAMLCLTASRRGVARS